MMFVDREAMLCCLDEYLFYDKEAIKQDVYEAGVKRRNSIEIAVEMLKRNMNLTDVSEITKLALYEVEKLKKQIDEGEI